MFVNGISVVICGTELAYQASTIAWSTKIENNHVMVSLPIDAAVTSSIALKRQFSVSVLGKNQTSVARQYGGKKQLNPLPTNTDDIDFDRWKIPTIKDCRAPYLCTVVQELKLIEQVVFIAEIKESAFNEKIDPLVYDHAEYFGPTLEQ